jgi:hypothetical protein
LANLRKTAGDRVKSADIDRVRRRRSANVEGGDRGCRERAGGFDEKIPAAKPLRIKLIFGPLHLNLPEIGALSIEAPALLAFWRFSISCDPRTTRDRDLLRDTALYTIL